MVKHEAGNWIWIGLIGFSDAPIVDFTHTFGFDLSILIFFARALPAVSDASPTRNGVGHD
jgi:hypothetical protein